MTKPDIRSRYIKLRVTQAQKTRLEDEAKKQGRSLSDWLRMRLARWMR